MLYNIPKYERPTALNGMMERVVEEDKDDLSQWLSGTIAQCSYSVLDSVLHLDHSKCLLIQWHVDHLISNA